MGEVLWKDPDSSPEKEIQTIVPTKDESDIMNNNHMADKFDNMVNDNNSPVVLAEFSGAVAANNDNVVNKENPRFFGGANIQTEISASDQTSSQGRNSKESPVARMKGPPPRRPPGIAQKASFQKPSSSSATKPSLAIKTNHPSSQGVRSPQKNETSDPHSIYVTPQQQQQQHPLDSRENVPLYQESSDSVDNTTSSLSQGLSKNHSTSSASNLSSVPSSKPPSRKPQIVKAAADTSVTSTSNSVATTAPARAGPPKRKPGQMSSIHNHADPGTTLAFRPAYNANSATVESNRNSRIAIEASEDHLYDESLNAEPLLTSAFEMNQNVKKSGGGAHINNNHNATNSSYGAPPSRSVSHKFNSTSSNNLPPSASLDLYSPELSNPNLDDLENSNNQGFVRSNINGNVNNEKVVSSSGSVMEGSHEQNLRKLPMSRSGINHNIF